MQCLLSADRPCHTCREFRPILKECYSQDTSQSSRLQFELKKSEAQNLCRAFNNASARVNLGAGPTRTASPAVASSSKAAASSSSTVEPPKTEVSYRHILLQLVYNGTAVQPQPRLAGIRVYKDCHVCCSNTHGPCAGHFYITLEPDALQLGCSPYAV